MAFRNSARVRSGRFCGRVGWIAASAALLAAVSALAVGREVGANEGLFVCPEGAACFAALKLLGRAGKIASGERVVIFNTGSGIKYLECY